MPAVQSQNQHSQSSLVTIVQGVVKRLEDSWNAADGAGFAEPFAVDADFVAIRGDLHTGRRAIGEGHQQIFDTIYAGSTARLEVLQARELDAGVILAHVRGTIDAPSGPLAGQHSATASVVLVPRGDDHEIASYHNTLVSG
jgi:uncharacterized protein (TIGR02246 family)